MSVNLDPWHLTCIGLSGSHQQGNHLCISMYFSTMKSISWLSSFSISQRVSFQPWWWHNEYTNELQELACRDLIYGLWVVLFESLWRHSICPRHLAPVCDHGSCSALPCHLEISLLSPADFMRHLWPICTRSSNQYYFNYGTWEWGKSWILNRRKKKKEEEDNYTDFLYIVRI